MGSGFDSAAFSAAEFVPRTAEVIIDSLSGFFPPDAKPIFTVRGLTYQEISYAEGCEEQRKDLPGLAAAIAGRDAQEIVGAITKLYGGSNKTSAHGVKVKEFVRQGCIDPVLKKGEINKLSIVAPAEFMQLFKKIAELTGLGQTVLEKPLPSGDATT